MKLAVFGGTGFIGRAVVERALDAGHTVRVLARDPTLLAPRERLEIVEGDARDPDAVRRTIGGVDAVISALGTPRGEKTEPDFLAGVMRTILSEMEQQRIRRIVAISGAGIQVDGELKPFLHRMISAVVGVLARNAVKAKQLEYEVLKASRLEWSAVRPTRVVDGPETDHPRIGLSAADIGMRVTRGDLARFVVAEAEQGAHARQTPFVSS